MDPAPFLRGCVFPGTRSVPYPRAAPDDAVRLPLDTWAAAQIPAGVRLELLGDADEVEIAYETRTDRLGTRGDGAGRTFELWRAGERIDAASAVLGDGRAVLRLGAALDERAVVYLPEGMKPLVHALEAHGGAIEPPPPQPRWIAYGDSIAEGWMASCPALAWPAIAGREQGLDVANLGYAGAARGEIASAEQIAALVADVISITYGTNCWGRTPHSVGLLREGLSAFLDVVRQGHPETPIVVSSPLVRPDAEGRPNRLGATLAALREAMEDVVRQRIEAGDDRLELVPGLGLVDAAMLPDGLHPDDEGHRALAGTIGPLVRKMLG